MALMMIRRGQEGGKITTEERVRLQDIFENQNERLPLSDDIVADRLKKEFRRLKIEGQRDVKSSSGSSNTSTYFTSNDRRSRFDDWKRSGKYQRSTSNPGFWRN